MGPEFLDDADVAHEYIHSQQEVKIPNIFKNLPDIDLPEKWSDGSDEQFIKYFSRPPEIMSHAYDAAMYYKKYGKFDTRDVRTDGPGTGFYYFYKDKIGRDVFDTYKYYIKQYMEKI